MSLHVYNYLCLANVFIKKRTRILAPQIASMLSEFQARALLARETQNNQRRLITFNKNQTQSTF